MSVIAERLAARRRVPGAKPHGGVPCFPAPPAADVWSRLERQPGDRRSRC